MSMIQETVLAFTAQDRKSTGASIAMSVVLTFTAVLAALFIASETRLAVLRLVLLVVATAEVLGAIGQGLFTRSLFKRQGRPDHPIHRGAIQDFSFYNLAMAVALILAALDPLKNSVVIDVYILLSLIHGGAHMIRFAFVSSSDRGAEVRQGLPLFVVALTMILFHP